MGPGDRHEDLSIRYKIILVVAISLFALGSPLIKWMTELSVEIGHIPRPKVSFCNILFLGNLIAAVVVFFYYRPSTILSAVKKVSIKGWIFVVLAAGFSILTPMLIVLALERTSVSNTILLSRLGPLLVAVLNSLIYRITITKLEWTGYGLILAAILISATLQGGGLNRGDALVLLSGVTYWMALFINHFTLEIVEKPIFTFCRNLGAAVIFACIAVQQFGWQHFGDLFHIDLWILVSIYSVVSVAGAQIAWFYALEHNNSKTVGNFSVLGPTIGFIFAYLLVGERPSYSQVFSLLLIVFGLVVVNWASIRNVVFPDSSASTVVGH